MANHNPKKAGNPNWKPGVSGNPAGSQKNREVTKALKKMLELSKAQREAYKPVNGYEELALSLVKSALDGDGKFRQRAHAQALVYDRIEGKPEPSDKEMEAMKAARTIVMDMPRPPATIAEVPEPPAEEKPEPMPN